MIIQNLHKNTRIKSKEIRSKNLLFLVFCFLSFFIRAQDSIATSSIAEDKNLQFQEYFFKALSQKAIRHYQKAIDNLDQCNQLLPNNKAVFFELSKNYYHLNKTFEAIEFANKALVLDSNNKSILKHLVSIYKKDRNFSEAIKTQEKIVKNHPKEKEALVILHFQNRDYSSAKNVIEELEKANMLTPRLRRLKSNLVLASLYNGKRKTKKQSTSNQDLEKQFLSEKKYTDLEKLLSKLDKEKSPKLLTYSKQGLELFPAQPLVYLMNGKALNTLNKHQEALETLQNGIDFVIDDKKLTAKFYKELGKAYQGLGNKKEADKYFKKAKQ